MNMTRLSTLLTRLGASLKVLTRADTLRSKASENGITILNLIEPLFHCLTHLSLNRSRSKARVMEHLQSLVGDVVDINAGVLPSFDNERNNMGNNLSSNLTSRLVQVGSKVILGQLRMSRVVVVVVIPNTKLLVIVDDHLGTRVQAIDQIAKHGCDNRLNYTHNKKSQGIRNLLLDGREEGHRIHKDLNLLHDAISKLKQRIQTGNNIFRVA